MKHTRQLIPVLLFAMVSAADGQSASERYADYEKLVAETHKASLKLREEALRKTIAKDSAWPQGIWGDNLWTLSALYLNEKVDEANARLLKQASDYIDRIQKHGSQPIATPEEPGNAPWTFFSVTDYVRTLCLFHSKSPHFPGRLKPETEAAMKEAVFLWVSQESRIADTGMDNLFLLLGTENHDLNRRPNYYLITALLQDDPAYRNLKLADGHTVAEHADAYTKFLREWPGSRARTGLWVEVGSNTYQKYSWPALFNLHELAPDPVIRERFGLLLDLAFVEEEQISVKGRRGGGRSRANYEANAFESYKNLLYAPEGQPAGSSHSRVIETSRYQLPAEAILLRYRTFPAEQPFVIRNRVLGEMEASESKENSGERLTANAALVNYAYRASSYLLGCTLQNPALTMRDPTTGGLVLKYSGISRQKRTCGMLFDDPDSATISGVYPAVEHIGGGRSQHSFWSVQHENVLFLQRIASGKDSLSSYNTGRLGIRFDGAGLEKIEEDGWIFASNGKAFVGAKFLDGPYQWDEKHVEAMPAKFAGPRDTTRILIHAGDAASYGTFARFREAVRTNPLQVTADQVNYHIGKQHIEMNRYDAAAPEIFTLPRINETPIDLRPSTTYQSPYLNGNFGSDRITVTVGPIKRVLDFSEESQ